MTTTFFLPIARMHQVPDCHPSPFYFSKKCRLGTVEPVLATTWQKRPPEICGHTISVPWIHGFKCTECVLENATTWEMRIADTEGRPKASIQPAKSDHIRKIERKTLFWLSNFPSQALRTSDHRVCKFQFRCGKRQDTISDKRGIHNTRLTRHNRCG